MDLDFFLQFYKNDELLGRRICLYIIAPTNLAPSFQNENYFRAGVAGSRMIIEGGRTVTSSGAESKTSSMVSRAAMYFANWIAGGRLIAALQLPDNVRYAPSGPLLQRVMSARAEDDARPDYARPGQSAALAYEALYHANMDKMGKVSRARTARVEWFKAPRDASFEQPVQAMKAVGTGTFYDFRKVKNIKPEALKGVKLAAGQVVDVTEVPVRTSERLAELRRDLRVGQEVEGEDGIIRLDASDIEDIRQNTPRGQRLLELITRKERVRKATQTTATEVDKTTNVRMTRSQVAMLRQTQNDEDEKRRKRLARALAQLAN